MRCHPILCAGLAGGVAGGTQALLAAPAENVRILLEGGSGGSSWTKAWKEVFQGTRSRSISRKEDIEDIRRLRAWMKDVGDMAGRGWNGWGWGFGKDICGFATFFSVFEVTRGVALQAKDSSKRLVNQLDHQEYGGVQRQLPRMIHGLMLVTGGVLAGLAYEVVFHEGLKSWSCCNDINKPVLDFEEFMKLPGCTEADCHTDEALKAEVPKPSSTTTLTMSESASGQETYSSRSPSVSASVPPQQPTITPIEVEEDDLSLVISPGTACRRNGCKVTFVSDAVNRQGDGEGTVCTYHPAPPIFREGSKTEEEITTCRVDHYQTVNEVHVSIYAKKADKERSLVEFEETRVKFTIYLPGPKKYSRTLDLFGPIDPKVSTYEVLGNKVELHLRKRDGRSWTLLEKTAQSIGNISLTFGVGGRTGTIGAKELVLDDVNQARKAQ
ncbi:hypothetical protein C0993_005220 [Termitomyces sp. T159_Od127]|nr:hypothetical protein C0993_005220 [Termitomyces sp. T159_Od127]